VALRVVTMMQVQVHLRRVPKERPVIQTKKKQTLGRCVQHAGCLVMLVMLMPMSLFSVSVSVFFNFFFKFFSKFLFNFCLIFVYFF
jgi:hypothetical protein